MQSIARLTLDFSERPGLQPTSTHIFASFGGPIHCGLGSRTTQLNPTHAFFNKILFFMYYL